MSADKVRWTARLDDNGPWAPFWLGLCIAIGYLLIRCAFDGLFLVTWGFPSGLTPVWLDANWWTEIVNATLLGYIPAVLMLARRGIDRDLGQLRSALPNGVDFDKIRDAALRPAGLIGKAFKLSGLVAGAALVFVDPSLSLGSQRSLANPVFLWPLLQTPLFTWLIFTFIVSDINATRTYVHVGRNLVEVDLLDVQSLSPFAHRGLRSALTWVVFSMIFSLFWVGDSASQANLLLFVTVLTMATAAFVAPLISVHNNILAEKRSELSRLRDEIRIERTAVSTDLLSEKSNSPRLANLIAYHQLIDRSREWPIDAANVLRFFMYLMIGLGSWLGGAIVERLLDSTLGG
ncbi:MAG: hypothetical protein ACI9ON_002053 [Limisphaerales bacterium]|jgi:hypothetical protein